MRPTEKTDRKNWQKGKGHEGIGKPNTVQELNKFREGGQKSYFSIICTPVEFELQQRPFFLAGKSGLIPTKINETLFSPLRQAFSIFRGKKKQCTSCTSHASTCKSIMQKALYPSPTQGIFTFPSRRTVWVFSAFFEPHVWNAILFLVNCPPTKFQPHKALVPILVCAWCYTLCLFDNDYSLCW